MSPAPIALQDVSRWFGNVVAVNNISFDVGPGITGLLGPNGAGKSTVLHMLSGFLRPSSGEVLIDGKSAWLNPGMYRRVGLVPEREAVYPFLTGRELVRLAARLQELPDPDEAADRAIALVEMQPAADRAAGGYSKGMKQRIKVAAAIVHDPVILLLDEPFNGMDPHQRLQMMSLLRDFAAQGRIILFSSHILEEVERIADEVLVVVAGRLAASGDFHQIRQLMTDRPHTFRLRTSDNRLLASAMLGKESIFGVDLDQDSLMIRTADYGAFTRSIATLARATGVTLFEVAPTDESLESVFSYLVRR
ncbi:MAG: ABC transporter ATP-binding protein [Dehalococcoidia bacterium]|nr:ABC transporter ATP-binding protein [Dehalococcoidia bacterium]